MNNADYRSARLDPGRQAYYGRIAIPGPRGHEVHEAFRMDLWDDRVLVQTRDLYHDGLATDARGTHRLVYQSHDRELIAVLDGTAEPAEGQAAERFCDDLPIHTRFGRPHAVLFHPIHVDAFPADDGLPRHVLDMYTVGVRCVTGAELGWALWQLDESQLADGTLSSDVAAATVDFGLWVDDLPWIRYRGYWGRHRVPRRRHVTVHRVRGLECVGPLPPDDFVFDVMYYPSKGIISINAISHRGPIEITVDGVEVELRDVPGTQRLG